MKITCLLGRIRHLNEGLPAVEKGEKNSRRWVIDFEVDQTSMLNFQLADWLSGKPLPKGLLVATVTPQNGTAARSAIYFPPLADSPYFTVAVELPEQRRPEGEGHEPALFRVLLDAPHTLMR